MKINNIKKSYVTLTAVGDIMLGNFHPGIGVRSILQKNNFSLFKHIKNILKSDLTFGNIETVLSNLNQKSTYKNLMLRGLPTFTKRLKKAGFNIVNVANNHLQEYGEEAALDSINNLKKEGFKIIGIDKLQPQIITVKNIKFAFLGYSLHPEQSICNKIIYSQGNTEKIKTDIIRIKKQVDYLIISLHWGYEYIETPSEKQILFAHQIIDSGADIILGHHPHVLQNIERYKNGIIAYSLGNFISDMHPTKTKKSIILKIKFSKNQTKNVDIVPIQSNKNYQPKPLKEKKAKKIIEKINKKPIILSKYEYKKQIKKIRKKLKIEWLLFLIKNCYKLPSKYLLEYTFSFINRKIIKKPKCSK